MSVQFPDPRQSTPEGIVALGGNLDPETLLAAYSQGIFPWPIADLPLTWFCPPLRGVIFFEDLHVPRSLKRELNKDYSYSTNQNFEEVIRSCATSQRGPEQDSRTWITPQIIDAYCELHHKGYAHSVEVRWQKELVAGIYGVFINGVFSGESMFFRKPNASKLALLELIRILKLSGLKWMDIQMVTPLMAQLGAREIPRDAFLDLLTESQKQNLQLNWKQS